MAEFSDDLRVAAELEDGEGEGSSGGVATGEEDSDELVADDFAVAGVGGEGVAESVAFRGFCFLVEFGLVKVEDALDVGADEGIDNFEAGAEFAAGEQFGEEGPRGVLVKVMSGSGVWEVHPPRVSMFWMRWTSPKAVANSVSGLSKLSTLLPRRNSVAESRVNLPHV